jgi:hypothetical protein
MDYHKNWCKVRQISDIKKPAIAGFFFTGKSEFYYRALIAAAKRDL